MARKPPPPSSARRGRVKRSTKPSAAAQPPYTLIEAVLKDKRLDAWTKYERAGVILGQAFEADLNVAVRALQQLYTRNQTSVEKAHGMSLGANGVGFDREDGPKLSTLCRKLESGARLGARELNTVLRYANKYRVQCVKTFPKDILRSIFVTTVSEEAKNAADDDDEDEDEKSYDGEADDEDEDEEEDEDEDEDEDMDEDEDDEHDMSEKAGVKAPAESASRSEKREVKKAPVSKKKESHKKNAKTGVLPPPCISKDVFITEFGMRGHMQFSNNLTNLMALTCDTLEKPIFAHAIFEKLQHVSGLTLSDVHAKLLSDFKQLADPKLPTQGGHVVLFERGAWRTCLVQKVFTLSNSTAVEIVHHDKTTCIHALLPTLTYYVV